MYTFAGRLLLCSWTTSARGAPPTFSFELESCACDVCHDVDENVFTARSDTIHRSPARSRLRLHRTLLSVIGAPRIFIVALALLLAGMTAARAAPLTIVNVSAPGVNCKFDASCKFVVTDTVALFTLPPTSGDAFLQTRTWPAGKLGTAGAGLIAYLYRIDMTRLAGVTALPCVNRLSLDFGPVSALDYNGDGTADQVFVITKGGLGTVRPSSASESGSIITFNFASPVCAGASVGSGHSSYFFGLASSHPPHAVTAQIRDSLGDTDSLAARAPAHTQTACGKASPNPRVFSTPGSYDFMVPAGVTALQVVAVGADGGKGADYETYSGGKGGKGGTATADSAAVTACKTLTVCVGGAAGDGTGTAGAGGGSACGYGGGSGGSGVTLALAGGGGGGASVVLRGSTALLVAGGGGGGGGGVLDKNGGDGGGGCGEGGAAGTAGEPGENSASGGGGGGAEGGTGGSSGPTSTSGGNGGTCGGTEISGSTPGGAGSGSDADGSVTISW